MNEKLKAILELIGIFYLIFSFVFTSCYFWFLTGKYMRAPSWAIIITLPIILIFAFLLVLIIIGNLLEN